MSDADRGPDVGERPALLNLIDFVRDRLDEEELTALATAHKHGGDVTLNWEHVGARSMKFDNGCSESYSCVRAGDLATGWDRILIARDDVRGGPLAKHIARWDPARVIGDIAAKRTVLYLAAATASVAATLSDVASGTAEECFMRGRASAAREAVVAISLGYATHPDYDPAWRTS